MTRLRPYHDSQDGEVLVRTTRVPFSLPVFFATFLILLLSGLALFFGILSHRAPPSHPTIEDHT